MVDRTNVDWESRLKPEEKAWLQSYDERCAQLKEDRKTYKKIRARCVTRALRAAGLMK